MSVHITKTYNIGGLIGLRQNAVKNAGETLGFKEMSLFKFPDAYDSDDELHVRMDGIIASLCPEDIVIFQHPSGESPRYDGFLFEHLRRYHGTKIVAFIQEIASDRDDSEYSLSDEITLLNRADMFIFASAALRDYYIANGLKEKPYLIQNIPDYMTDICTNEHKNKKLYIMAETSQNEYPLNNLNIEVVQYDEYRAMESILRLSDGGFGIVVYMVIICLLTIIFSMVMLSPGRTADDLLKSGDSIQDIYAGKSTKRYLIGTVLSFSVISSIIICICQGGPLFLQFGGYVDASLAMLPCSIMMTTGLWISLYREAEVYRNMDRYHTFI